MNAAKKANFKATFDKRYDEKALVCKTLWVTGTNCTRESLVQGPF
jgi:hypothetical protein